MTQIILAVSGSISAYKAADITSRLKKENFKVAVLMTEAATEFITPLTLQVLSQRPVAIDIMQEPDPSKVNHIDIAKESDLFLLAPATANTIATSNRFTTTLSGSASSSFRCDWRRFVFIVLDFWLIHYLHSLIG